MSVFLDDLIRYLSSTFHQCKFQSTYAPLAKFQLSINAFLLLCFMFLVDTLNSSLSMIVSVMFSCSMLRTY